MTSNKPPKPVPLKDKSSQQQTRLPRSKSKSPSAADLSAALRADEPPPTGRRSARIANQNGSRPSSVPLPDDAIPIASKLPVIKKGSVNAQGKAAQVVKPQPKKSQPTADSDPDFVMGTPTAPQGGKRVQVIDARRTFKADTDAENAFRTKLAAQITSLVNTVNGLKQFAGKATWTLEEVAFAEMWTATHRKHYNREISDDERELLDECSGKDANDETVVSTCGRIPVKAGDIYRARTMDVWVNDIVINAYFQLIAARSHSRHHVVCLDVVCGSLSIDSKQAVDILLERYIDTPYNAMIIPFHVSDNHFNVIFMEFNYQTQEIFAEGYDSLSDNNFETMTKVLDAFGDRLDYSTNFWTLKDGPKQADSSSCGIFCCMYAERKSRQAPLDFKNADLPYERERIALELINGRLSDERIYGYKKKTK